MKILELTTFSAGICGVWARVKEESVRLAEKGHEVRVFSSNFVKGKEEVATETDKIDNVLIKRFKAKKLGGESYMAWDWKEFRKEILDYKPNVIIAHSYRHTHTIMASRIAKEIGAKCFLVTHAPFGRKRGFIAGTYVWLWDKVTGKRQIKEFDKIIAITKWEMPYLKELGVPDEKIEYIPNGIPEEFFSEKKGKEERKILFLGRISPIKDLETLIRAVSIIEDNKVKIEIVGPAEEDYLIELKTIIEKLNLKDRIVFSPAIYDVREKIKKIDSAMIFVLPSKSEGMPQSLIEAMAREKIVVASNNPGSSDLVEDGKTGYLFKIGDEKDLAMKINIALKDNKNIRKNASSYVKQFSWEKIIEKLEKIL